MRGGLRGYRPGDGVEILKQGQTQEGRPKSLRRPGSEPGGRPGSEPGGRPEPASRATLVGRIHGSALLPDPEMDAISAVVGRPCAHQLGARNGLTGRRLCRTGEWPESLVRRFSVTYTWPRRTEYPSRRQDRRRTDDFLSWGRVRRTLLDPPGISGLTESVRPGIHNGLNARRSPGRARANAARRRDS